MTARKQAQLYEKTEGILRALTTEATSKLNVLGLDSDTLGVNLDIGRNRKRDESRQCDWISMVLTADWDSTYRSKIGVFKQSNKVRLGSLLLLVTKAK